MVNLILEDLFLSTPKNAPKEYPFPVAKITPQYKKVKDEDVKAVADAVELTDDSVDKNAVVNEGTPEREVSSGCISFSPEVVEMIGYIPGKKTSSRIAVGMAKTASFIYECSSLPISDGGKKKLPDSRVLRISRVALEAIYAKHGLDVNDAWVFELVEGCIELGGVKDLKVLVLKPLEKRA